MEPWTAARSASRKRIPVVEAAAIEVVVVEAVAEVVAIDDRAAVRDVGIVVIDH